MYSNIKYFEGLSSLRFFAAFLVLIHHLEQIRLKNEMFNFKKLAFFNNGGIAVSFFFVLSGFLITYLLISEKSKSGTISIKNFYFRRILRIWPLYYLLIILGTLILPVLFSALNINYIMPYKFNDVIYYYVLFSPFLVNLLFGNHFLEPLWSIGVEEIFYIIWAPIVYYINKSIFLIALSIIFLKFLIVTIVFNFFTNEFLEDLILLLSFESMAIGAVGAHYIFYLNREVKDLKLFSKNVQILLLIILMFRFVGFNVLNEIFPLSSISIFLINIFYNVLFLWLIINVSLNTNSIIKLNLKLLNQLGDISYGIYMYHMLVIFSLVFFFKDSFNKINDYLSSFLFYVITIFITIVISHLSKKYFEDYFLKLKYFYK